MQNLNRRNFLKTSVGIAASVSLPSLAFANIYKKEKIYAKHCADFINGQSILTYFQDAPEQIKYSWQWNGTKGIGSSIFFGKYQRPPKYSFDSSDSFYYHFKDRTKETRYISVGSHETFNITMTQNGDRYNKHQKYLGHEYVFYVDDGINAEVIRSMIKNSVDLKSAKNSNSSTKGYFIKDIVVKTSEHIHD